MSRQALDLLRLDVADLIIIIKIFSGALSAGHVVRVVDDIKNIFYALLNDVISKMIFCSRQFCIQ